MVLGDDCVHECLAEQVHTRQRETEPFGVRLRCQWDVVDDGDREKLFRFREDLAAQCMLETPPLLLLSWAICCVAREAGKRAAAAPGFWKKVPADLTSRFQ